MASTFEADAQNSCHQRSVAALEQLPPLARHVGDHQPAAVQHADELAELFEADLLRGELLFELPLEIVEAALPVEHLQQGEFFFLKAEVVQPDRVFDDPIRLPLIALPPSDQIGPQPQSERPSRAGQQAVGKRGHGRKGLGRGA